VTGATWRESLHVDDLASAHGVRETLRRDRPVIICELGSAAARYGESAAETFASLFDAGDAAFPPRAEGLRPLDTWDPAMPDVVYRPC